MESYLALHVFLPLSDAHTTWPIVDVYYFIFLKYPHELCTSMHDKEKCSMYCMSCDPHVYSNISNPAFNCTKQYAGVSKEPSRTW